MADKDKGQFYAPPPKRSAGEQIRTFLWNSETNQFLGRTAGSWGMYSRVFIFFVKLINLLEYHSCESRSCIRYRILFTVVVLGRVCIQGSVVDLKNSVEMV